MSSDCSFGRDRVLSLGLGSAVVGWPLVICFSCTLVTFICLYIIVVLDCFNKVVCDAASSHRTKRR